MDASHNLVPVYWSLHRVLLGDRRFFECLEREGEYYYQDSHGSQTFLPLFDKRCSEMMLVDQSVV